MQAQYAIKVQAIRSKKQAPRFYVNIPLPLAAALDLEHGEHVQWQLLSRNDLRLIRVSAPAPTPSPKLSSSPSSSPSSKNK
jgi:hypothetical protein